MKQFSRRLVQILLLLLLIFLGLSWFFAYKLTGPHQRRVGDPPADFPFPIQAVTFATSDHQTLHGWFVPASPAEKAIILLHGYGGDRRQMVSRARFFREQGFAVLLYDARACGESSGDMVTLGYHETKDLVAAIAFLKEQGLTRIACLGVSQGGATILLAAEQLDGVRCVICESAFDEIGHAVDNRFRRSVKLPGWLAGSLMVPLAEYRTGLSTDQIKPVDHIGKLKCPVFILSGEEDVKTLPADTLRLFQAAPEPKELWMVPGVSHRDLFTQDGYQEKVRAFVARHVH